MMNELFYTELRIRSKEMRSRGIALPGTNQYQELFKGIDTILEMSSVARREGCLALEETDLSCGKYPRGKYPLGKYLAKLISLIVDGTQPEQVEEIGMALYYSAHFNARQGLLYLIYLYGVLSIQRDENQWVIQERLLAMLPDKAVKEYHEKKKKEEIEERKTSDQEDGEKLLEQLYLQQCPVSRDHECYPIFKMAEYAFEAMDDRSIQRFLRDVDNSDLGIFIKGQSGNPCKAIMNNLSTRLSIMIAEDMDFMGPVRLKDIAEATRKILRTMLRLMSSGEIMCTGGEDYLSTLYKIYCEDESDSNNGASESGHAFSNLEEVFNEYLDIIDRTI